jgi:hypothetical protein
LFESGLEKMGLSGFDKPNLEKNCKMKDALVKGVLK